MSNTNNINGDNGSTPIETCVSGFLRVAGARSRHTASAYRTPLRHFLAFLEEQGITADMPVASLTLDHARDFAAWLANEYLDGRGRPLSENSRVLYLQALRRFYRYLIVGKRLPDVTYGDYVAMCDDLGKTASRRKQPIEKSLPDPEIVKALVEEARRRPTLPDDATEGHRKRLLLGWRRDLAMVLTLQSSGMRAGELVSLRRGDLEHENQGAYVTGKGNKQRFVRLSAEAWGAVEAYLVERADGETGRALMELPLFCRHDKRAGNRRLPLSTRTLRSIVEEMAVRAGIAEKFHMSPHKLRHYFATRFLRGTGDLAATQDALGHASPDTTRVYAKVTKDDLVKKHRQVFDGEETGD